MNNLKSLIFSKVFHKVQLSPNKILDNELLHTSNSSMTLKCMYRVRVMVRVRVRKLNKTSYGINLLINYVLCVFFTSCRIQALYI